MTGAAPRFTVTDIDLHRNGRGFVAGRTASDDLLAALFRSVRDSLDVHGIVGHGAHPAPLGEVGQRPERELLEADEIRAALGTDAGPAPVSRRSHPSLARSSR